MYMYAIGLLWFVSVCHSCPQLDLYVENLSILRKRRDDVFSQAVSSLIPLVAHSYPSLSHTHTADSPGHRLLLETE